MDRVRSFPGARSTRRLKMLGSPRIFRSSADSGAAGNPSESRPSTGSRAFSKRRVGPAERPGKNPIGPKQNGLTGSSDFINAKMA